MCKLDGSQTKRVEVQRPNNAFIQGDGWSYSEAQRITKEDRNNDILKAAAHPATSLIRQAPLPLQISNFVSPYPVMRLIFNESARISRDVISVSILSSAGTDKQREKKVSWKTKRCLCTWKRDQTAMEMAETCGQYGGR